MLVGVARWCFFGFLLNVGVYSGVLGALLLTRCGAGAVVGNESISEGWSGVSGVGHPCVRSRCWSGVYAENSGVDGVAGVDSLWFPRNACFGVNSGDAGEGGVCGKAELSARFWFRVGVAGGETASGFDVPREGGSRAVTGGGGGHPSQILLAPFRFLIT